MLNRAKIEFSEDSDGDITVERGYIGFFTFFTFNEDGSLKNMEAAE